MRGGIESRTEPGSIKNSSRDGGRGSFSLGACNVDALETVLRVVQPLQEVLHSAEVKIFRRPEMSRLLFKVRETVKVS
jgi:hypothetical protein